MLASANVRSPLIVESDPAFIETLQADPRSKRLPPVIAQNGRDAQILLSDYGRSFAGIFVNPTIVRPNGISVIRCAHQFHPATPVYALYDGEPPFSPEELKKLGIQQAIPKPLAYSQIIALVAPLISVFEPEDALSIAKKNSDPLDVEISDNDSKFISIRANQFLAGSTSFFDVYFRLRSGKYLKLLQAGDSFSPDRLSNYIKKGATHFFLRKDAQEQYVSYCDQLTTALLKSQTIPLEIKASQTMNQGEETLKYLHSQGISELNLKYAANFVLNVGQLMKNLNPEKHPALYNFLNDVVSYEHGVATTMIASLILHPLKITSIEPVETVGLAGLLHDIGLRTLPPELWDEDESEMSEKERIIYRKHPIAGADILKSVPGLKPATIQAVLQHHERRNRKGFPHQLGPGTISMVSEIIGMSDEFAHIIQAKNKYSEYKFHDELERRIYTAFSAPLVSEFKRIFLLQSQ